MNRSYQLIECTTSLCSKCLKRIDAKIVLKNNSIFLLKYCPEHGEHEEIMEEDGKYYLSRLQYDKPGTTCKTQTERKRGCPYDCGLCPDHEQHTCTGLIEVTNNCDLNCPVCYAQSGSGNNLSLSQIEKMLDLFVDSEQGNAEILQISGGEPTCHPEITEIIKLARRKKIKYVMLNTNGLRIAEDEDFVKDLSHFLGGFEIYLQFDGFDDEAYKKIRGKSLAAIKKKAIDNLAKYQIPATLVSTIVRGVNEKEIGEIIKFGLESENIRGVNFQPVAFFGRLGAVKRENRITLTGIIGEIEEQTKGMIKKSDFIPLPCNVDRVALTYLYKTGEDFVPLMRNIDFKKYLPLIRNTFKFDADDFLKDFSKDVFSKDGGCCGILSFLNKIRKIIPKEYYIKSEEEKIRFVSQNTFRISVTSFVDAYNFDMRSMKKECVHVITPDLKKIPFSAYNILHRNANQ